MHEYGRTLHALHIALLEIRAATNFEGAKLLADAFHHVPILMANGRPEDEIVSDVLEISERHGMSKAVARFFDRS
jgi:hypothetical protein